MSALAHRPDKSGRGGATIRLAPGPYDRSLWQRALLVIFAFGALHAHAEPLLERAQSRSTLNVCTSDEFPPFKTFDAQGKPGGLILDLIVDLQQQLSAKVGQPLKLQLVPVNPLNRLLFLEQGRCEVLVTSLLDTPARRREVDFASPGFYSSAATVFAPKSTAVPDWQSLRGKTLCAPATSVWVRPFETRYGVQFASFNGTAEVRKAVADSRCLGAMGDDALYSALARQPEWADYEVKLPGQDPAPWGIALRKGQPALLAALSSIVEGWHAQGVIIGLEQRYGLAPNAWVAQQHARASHE
ncbi:transporter substrate-binding domain-containing protein [Pseudomonas marginalis]|uniref:transporter substrate-binding domain-containing protein n=1 Tax=Pseudomonas marginalis TaxID=298 RepID=UPI0011B41C35|nr:transporter substrate-binding domain-containing protein [Pseudomonas marginalis]KAA8554134.1 putative amino-acid ABC transporter-binding protein [Pseudomonas marginalis]TWR72972.1 transporter substrate-binding domain-containing protein [Pseudomonas marginalis]